MKKITILALATVFLGTVSNTFAMEGDGSGDVSTPRVTKLTQPTEDMVTNLNHENNYMATSQKIKRICQSAEAELQKAMEDFKNYKTIDDISAYLANDIQFAETKITETLPRGES